MLAAHDTPVLPGGWRRAAPPGRARLPRGWCCRRRGEPGAEDAAAAAAAAAAGAGGGAAGGRAAAGPAEQPARGGEPSFSLPHPGRQPGPEPALCRLAQVSRFPPLLGKGKRALGGMAEGSLRAGGRGPRQAERSAAAGRRAPASRRGAGKGAAARRAPEGQGRGPSWGERGDPIPGAGAGGGCWIPSASGFTHFILPGQQGGTCRGCELHRFVCARGMSGRAGWMEGRRSSGGTRWKQHGDKLGRAATLRAGKGRRKLPSRGVMCGRAGGC